MRIAEVFTPNEIPTVTYVSREEKKLEDGIKIALETPNMITAISGPSKSGKTVTLKKVIDENLIIPLSGGNIKSVNDLWRQLFAWMGEPIEFVKNSSTEVSARVGGSAEGQLGLPLFAKAKGQAEASAEVSRSGGNQETLARDFFAQTIKEIGGSDFVIFIDDFHYIPRDVQDDLAKVIKALAEARVNICVASVPHRSDDAVRANPELRGRLVSIDFTYWEEDELMQIAEKGFDALNIKISNDVYENFAKEASGSPQLMQSLCLLLCQVKLLKERQRELTELGVSQVEYKDVLERAAQWASFSSMLRSIHAGPKVRGNERKQFQFDDGSKGDVYRAILLAIRADPRKLTLRYAEIMDRITHLCKGESPVGSSVSQALHQADALSDSHSPAAPVLEWDDDILNIVDPYFLFYLRCSPQMATLGSEGLSG